MQKLGADTAKAAPFLAGCPACYHNFVHFWCALTCHPDQAAFANVTAVQPAHDDASVTAVAEVEYWVAEAFGQAFYGACKDVRFGAANTPAMAFVGGGAKDYQQWLDFLGMVKDQRVPPVGSPFQQNFRPENATPPGLGLAPFNATMASCADSALRCSCGDCPVAPGCGAAPSGGRGRRASDRVCRIGAARCWDLAVILSYVVIVAVVLGRLRQSRRLWRRLLRSKGAAPGGGLHLGGANGRESSYAGLAAAAGDEVGGVAAPLMAGQEEEDEDEDGWPTRASRYGNGHGKGAGGGDGGGAPWADAGGVAGGQPEEEPAAALAGGTVRYPWLERKLQAAFYAHGVRCGKNPATVLSAGMLLLGFCLLGLVRFR